MPYSIVLNGEDHSAYHTRREAKAKFDRIVADPGTTWAALVRANRGDMTVVEYYERVPLARTTPANTPSSTLPIPHRTITGS